MSARAERIHHRRRRGGERSSLQLLEESFHLLRRADARHYLVFYAGTVPFALGLLYFAAEMSGRRGDGGSAAPGALAALMTLLYFAMRWCQAAFCTGLWSTLQPGRGSLGAGDTVRAAGALWLVQALQVPLLLVGTFFVIPFAWTVALLQNATVLAFVPTGARPGLRDLVGRSLRYSHDDWAQNHGALVVLAAVAFFTWANLLATVVLSVRLGRSLLGIESVFTISPAAAMVNATFFLATLLLAYLVVSPMLKAVYVLRCFYASSRESGADLLARLDAVEKETGPDSRSRPSRPSLTPRAPGALGAALGAMLFGLASLPSTAGAEPTTAHPERAAAAVETAEIDGESLRIEIGRTLVQSKYRWTLPRERDEIEGDESSWFATQLRRTAESVCESVGGLLTWLWKQLERALNRERPSGGGVSFESGFFAALGPWLSVALGILVAFLVAWVLWIVYRRHRDSKTLVVEGVSGETVDLRSEDIVASQLPEDEWMRLAREQIDRGDPRLAMRAVFLATLAGLGESRLVRVARFKSNRDYRSELERRAQQFADLHRAFGENTSLFERSWYGRHAVSEGAIERFLVNHETIIREAAVAADRVKSLPLAR